MATQDSSPRRVMMLAFEAVQILDVTGPLEIMAAANELLPGEPPVCEIALVAEQAGPLRTSAGLRLVADHGFGEIGDAQLEGLHTFIVAGGEGTTAALRNRPMLGFVRRAAAAAERLASVCSGSAILAAAGLLDGRRATTHWNAAPAIARAFPKVRLEPDAIYVRDGNIWTSAGITAGMDMAVAMVEADLGREAALHIARRHVLYMMRPGGQSQFSDELKAQTAAGTRTAKAVSFVSANLSRDLSAPALAEAVGLSERTLVRAFRTELDTTPAAFVQRARVDAARRRLSGGRTAVESVALSCGFSSAEIMRRAFQRELGVSPAEYRDRFTTAQRRTS